jgi:hypothetical protein
MPGPAIVSGTSKGLNAFFPRGKIVSIGAGNGLVALWVSFAKSGLSASAHVDHSRSCIKHQLLIFFMGVDW